MTVQVELFRSTSYLGPEYLPLAPLLREVFAPVLRRPLARARFLLNLVAEDDSEPLRGHPTLVNLRPSHGYAHVSIVDQEGTVVYQHPHTVREIVAVPLQRRLRQAHPDVSYWGFGLVGPGLEELAMVRPTPEVAGSVDIPSIPRRRGSHVEELAEPTPPPGTLAELNVADADKPHGGPRDDLEVAPVAVVLRPSAYRTLMAHEFSLQVEEGGFVIGHRLGDRDHPGRQLLEVTAFVPAESTGASLWRLTFTGESYLRLSDLAARRGRSEQLLGWYHTHLFPATTEFGLSTVDVQLHTSTFRRRWQVAALLNLDGTGRVLRFYRPNGDELSEAPFWVAGQPGEPAVPRTNPPAPPASPDDQR